MFIITSQWNGKKFDEITCNLDPEKDQNYGAYVTGNEQICYPNSILNLFIIRKKTQIKHSTFDII